MATDINQLAGLELRKAVAEAVGWEWMVDTWMTYAWQPAGDSTLAQKRFLSTLKLSWDDAIAACEAADLIGTDCRMLIDNSIWIQKWKGYPKCWVTIAVCPENLYAVPCCKHWRRRVELKSEVEDADLP